MITNKYERLRRILACVVLFMLVAVFFLPITLNSCEREFNNDDVEVATEPVIEQILIDEPVVYSTVNYESFVTKAQVEAFKETVLGYIDTLDALCSSGEYTEEAIIAMADEELRLWEIIHQLDADIDRFNTWEEEYYYAALVWQSLRAYGLNEAVTAGIIGNMMVETGGGTLSLKPRLYCKDKGHYGLCQWSLHYRPNVAEMPFEEQLAYLKNDLKKEFDAFGFCYKRNFGYDEFLLLEDPRAAGIAFAKVYERGNPAGNNYRGYCAEVAYEYFTGKDA